MVRKGRKNAVLGCGGGGVMGRFYGGDGGKGARRDECRRGRRSGRAERVEEAQADAAPDEAGHWWELPFQLSTDLMQSVDN